ncbi:hypothetical protein HaLaN_21728 [Haematococcus lacustris]|uniref:Uncharacterized protein n=1 Tax=Haematococcus lacustris TaxID=44745 RepID=A0A699ZYY7_HAELA|nr:hypothetical protein HaLaN_21728 [Haematococcus lacustris]
MAGRAGGPDEAGGGQGQGQGPGGQALPAAKLRALDDPWLAFAGPVLVNGDEAGSRTARLDRRRSIIGRERERVHRDVSSKKAGVKAAGIAAAFTGHVANAVS